MSRPTVLQRVLHPLEGRGVVSTSLEILVLVALAMALALVTCARPRIVNCTCPSLQDGTFQVPDAPAIAEFPREEGV